MATPAPLASRECPWHPWGMQMLPRACVGWLLVILGTGLPAKALAQSSGEGAETPTESAGAAQPAVDGEGGRDAQPASGEPPAGSAPPPGGELPSGEQAAPPAEDPGASSTFVVPPPEATSADTATPYYPQPTAPAPRASSGVSRRYAYGVPARWGGRVAGPGAREHDGLFVRLSLGFGAGTTTYRESVDGRSTQDIETRGLAALIDISVGGRVARNLLLHGTILLSDVGPAQKRVDGARNASSRNVDNSMGLIGAGLTYYFMPANAYVSWMLGAGFLSETRDDVQIDSKTGVGTALMLGKEWWVGPRAEWGLGAALRLSYFAAGIDIAGIDSRMRGGDVGIAFCATYN